MEAVGGAGGRNSRIMASRLRMTRSGGSLRTKIVMRGRGGDRFVTAHAGHDRHDECDRIARKAHDQKADGGVPEADHRPGHGQREQQQQERVGHAEAAGRERSRGERQQGCNRDQHESGKYGPPPADIWGAGTVIERQEWLPIKHAVDCP